LNPPQVRHFHCDHLGTPIGMTQATGEKWGELVWAARYDAWGKTAREHNPHSIEQPIRFQGQQFDRESGLHYNRFRFYDSCVGGYLSQDLIRFIAGANFSTYVNGRPNEYVDALGLDGINAAADKAAGIPSGSIKDRWNTPSNPIADPFYPFSDKPPSPTRPDGQPWGYGCGDKDTDHKVPDVVGGANLLPACRKHDACYEGANRPGADKNTCDNNFKKDVNEACMSAGHSKTYCGGVSNVYYLGVNKKGGPAWEAAKAAKP
ncbi:phospholipase A2, partial [Sphingomonas sp. NCPPB 2930]